jgi:hypothetical protein
MSAPFLHVAEDFWNIRGSYKIGGVLDVGTHASLVRLASGKFVFLDSYTLDSSARRKVAGLTSDGEDIEAILNVHPFHTVHVRKMHELYPNATLYGTERHLSRFPELPWADIRTEDAELHEQYSDDLDFSVPRGVDFISDDENLHFSSVLVFHRASKTIHSDDTLMYLRLPGLMRFFGMGDSVGFHPTLAKTLEKRSGAVQDFRDWANELFERWKDTENLCAAHTGALLERNNRGESIQARLRKALEKVGKTLDAHEKKYG